MRFDSETPFLDEDALELLKVGSGEAEYEPAPTQMFESEWHAPMEEEGAETLEESETRAQGRLKMRADHPAAVPRRSGRSLTGEASEEAEPAQQTLEEAEMSLPGMAITRVQGNRVVEKEADDSELSDESNARPLDEFSMREDDVSEAEAQELGFREN